MEVFFRGDRVSSHVRSYQRGVHTTIGEHMPKSHRAHAEWSPQRLIQWGVSIGANTRAVVEHLLRSKPHPERGYRAGLGLLSLSRKYGDEFGSRQRHSPCGCAVPPAKASSRYSRAAVIDPMRNPNPRTSSCRSTATYAVPAITTDDNDKPERRRRC